MNTQFLTAGQFAKLASTTKRTIIWYGEKGILKPVKINSSGYRLYKPEQIIDFQVILLLRTLGFSIDEIKSYLKKNSSLKELFLLKKEIVADEIERLKFSLKNINSLYHNMATTQTLVSPKVKAVSPFDVYYIQKCGPYAEIYHYFLELLSYFEKVPKEAVSLVLFEEPGYQPKKSLFKVCLTKVSGLKLKKEFESKVSSMTVPGYKCLSVIYEGSPSLLSLLWQELKRYSRNYGFKKNNNLPFNDLEYYLKTAINGQYIENRMVSEINLPII